MQGIINNDDLLVCYGAHTSTVYKLINIVFTLVFGNDLIASKWYQTSYRNIYPCLALLPSLYLGRVMVSISNW